MARRRRALCTLLFVVAGAAAQSESAAAVAATRHRTRELRDEAAESCWGGDESWDEQSPAFLVCGTERTESQ